MRNRQPWYSFRLIVPALIILPPLGLILLWKSPRTARAKLVTSVLFLVFVTGAFVGSVKTGFYARYIESRQPREDVYDVRMNSRQAFVSNEVLPFERKVFAAVTREMKVSRVEETATDLQRDIVEYESLSPNLKAFEAVADEYGLDPEDVQSIYRKVSIVLSK